MKDYNIKIDEDIWQQAKVEAARRKISLKRLVGQAIEQFLKGVKSNK